MATAMEQRVRRWKDGARKGAVEAAVWLGARMAPARAMPESPAGIFCLRNNDLGDVIVVTPLFEALKRRFPDARVIVGVGSWAADILKFNPFVDRVLEINAPWHNRFSTEGVPHYGNRGLARSARYILRSREARELSRLHCDVGIDILGSPEGSALLMRAGIPHRLGVRGYAGGHSGTQGQMDFSADTYVGRFALGFAGILGLAEADYPPPKPQLFLSGQEKAGAALRWAPARGRRRLLVGLGTGGGERRSWPAERFRELLELVSRESRWTVALCGSAQDRPLAEVLATGLPGVIDWTGSTGLREAFALVEAADAVVCNASMLMHAASAFDKRTAVVLGPDYPSALRENRLWNCNPQARVLGREIGSTRGLATPDEIFQFLAGGP